MPHCGTVNLVYRKIFKKNDHKEQRAWKNEDSINSWKSDKYLEEGYRPYFWYRHCPVINWEKSLNQKGKPRKMDLPLLKNDITSSEVTFKTTDT
jgi:hypothetical protein